MVQRPENEIKMKIITALFFSVATFSSIVFAHGDKHQNEALFKGLDSPAAKVVVAFHEALKSGDKQQAQDLLADDVTIFEGGGVERSALEYAQHHMLADMAYLNAVDSQTLEHQVEVVGTTAISISRSHTKGVYKGKERDYESMETMILELQKGSWKIIHIHWSN